ncbi:MAG: PD40 domain-containing protein [Phycisphaeraceae bacterium]|nr:PD40 domain-containing protein [Phycisphaeraceae bacterium]
MKRIWFTVLLFSSLFGTSALGDNAIKNLGSTAKISASGRFSEAYGPKFLVDGKIPEADSRQDQGAAWCVPLVVAKEAWVSFDWDKAVEIKSIVYWGRCAWMATENFSACQVYVNGADEPTVNATLVRGPQAQVITLPTTVKARQIRLVFPSNFGGSNPGASEIGIFSTTPSKAQLSDLNTLEVELSKETAAQIAAGQFGFTQLLLVQRYLSQSTHVYTYHQEGLKPGGALWIAGFENGKPDMTKILDSSEGQILDATLHYDSRTILFSWKQTMTDFFQLYTIEKDGTNLKQLTSHSSNNFNASFLPDGDIVFLSDRKPAYAYCWKTTTPILWRCNSDGSQSQRISSNYLNDFTPAVMSDGRILYARWEYVDRPAIPIQSLWSINPDGTQLEGVFGNRSLSPATFMDAREIPGPGKKILCVLTAHNGTCRGAIGLVDPTIGGNAQEAIVNLTPEVNIGSVNAGSGNHIRGPYLNPFPVNDAVYLVSKAGVIQLRDYQGERCDTLIPRQDNMGFFNPQPIRQRPRERLIASSLKPTPQTLDTQWATLMMQDVYNGLGDSVPRGSIKKLAIVQEIEKPLGIDPGLRAFGFQFPVVSCGATYAPKKIWGYATVEADGSANFQVPAEKPIYFLPLDAKGMAVQRMRTFTHLMPGEVQSCVGCHADRNYAMANTTGQSPARATAMMRKTESLTEPSWSVTGFSYPHIVQPILDAHCVECHGHDEPGGGLELTGDKTDFFNVSYENLARKGTQATDWRPGGAPGDFGENKYTSWIATYNGQEGNILQIEPGQWGAKASLLAQVIDQGHPDTDGQARVDMTPDEKARIYAWLDLNVPYYGTSHSNYTERRGCRQQLPDGFDALMADVSKRRCVTCHKEANNSTDWMLKSKDRFYIRIDNPERNSFLMAPLAKEAGGTAQCGAPVFKTTDDADYQKFLAAFDQLKKKLEQQPRYDMMPLEDQWDSCQAEEKIAAL